MSRSDVEDLVREAFRSHEHEVGDGRQGLAAGVRARLARRRRMRTVAAGVGTLAVLAAVGAVPLVTGNRPGSDHPGEGRSPTAEVELPGWRWESALGAEIRVPDGWLVNEYGCGMSDQPSVVRGGGGPAYACGRIEPATKSVAIIGERAAAQPGVSGLPERPVTVDGTPAVRAEGLLPDGRYAGSVAVSSPPVAVTVRTRDEATTRRILDSFRLVETDHAGCTTRRLPVPGAPVTQQPSDPPAPAADRSPERTPFVPVDPSSIAICYYGEPSGRPGDRLQVTVRLTGVEAEGLAASLNAARPGGNSDFPGASCLPPDPSSYEALLLVRGPDGPVRVKLSYTGCSGRGLDNGVRRAQVTKSLLFEIMRALDMGFVMPQDLPD